jgi:hypothetical protein
MSYTCGATSASPASSGSGGARCAAILKLIDTCLSDYESACAPAAAGRVGSAAPHREARP